VLLVVGLGFLGVALNKTRMVFEPASLSEAFTLRFLTTAFGKLMGPAADNEGEEVRGIADKDFLRSA
jgi:hypothetical protein